jgi:hypothetical protein
MMRDCRSSDAMAAAPYWQCDPGSFQSSRACSAAAVLVNSACDNPVLNASLGPDGLAPRREREGDDAQRNDCHKPDDLLARSARNEKEHAADPISIAHPIRG